MITSKLVSAMADDFRVGQRLFARLLRASDDHQHWIFDEQLECAEQLRPKRTVNRAMIGRERGRHYPLHLDLAILHDGALLASADGENGGMRRVNNRGKILDPKHAQIGN